MRVKTATGSTGGTRRAQHLSARAVCALCAPLILPLALAGCNAPTPTGWESLGDANVMIGLSMARDPNIHRSTLVCPTARSIGSGSSSMAPRPALACPTVPAFPPDLRPEP